MTDINDDRALREIISRAVGRDVSALRPADSLRRILGLDMVDMIRIVVAAETVYGVECDPEEIRQLDRYGDLMARLGVGVERIRSAA